MGIISRLPDWNLNYHVAAFGAYITIFLEVISLILRGFEHSSLLSISILTNASAVLVAGFGGISSTPLAILRICLTNVFLLCALILQGNEKFDGTYAILCSVAHFTYQLGWRRYINDPNVLPQYEKCAKTEEAPSEGSLHTPLMDYNDTAKFSGSLRILFGDSLCLEGAMVPVTILGTAMTYRVFDFDLGFGLVFAFASTFLSSIILLFIYRARMRGQRVDTQRSVQILVGLLLVFGIFFFILFATLDSPDIDFSWWRIAFGVAWFVFLFRTTYIACRFLTHATLFPCAACSQREAGIHGPLTQAASVGCIWDDYNTLPALNQNMDHTSGEPATFWIRRQKGPDLVERFWLNDQECFQVSPRTFVICLVSCIALAAFSGGALNPEGSLANIGSHVSTITAFYVTMAFTFVSTSHTAAGDSPELMFVPLNHSFPQWEPIVKAIITTMLIHLYIVFVAPVDRFTIFVAPITCVIMAPLLLAGISKPWDPTGQQANIKPSTESEAVNVSSDGWTSSTAEAWTIDSTLVYSSRRIRGFDLRVLLLGLSIAFFDVLCNKSEDKAFFTAWPANAVISMSVTAVWLYLENMLPRSQDLEPGALTLAVTALLGNSSPVILPNASGLYDKEWEDQSSTDIMLVHESASRSKHIWIALWYTTLVSMVVVNRRLVHQKAERALSSTKGRPPMKDHLLFSFHVKTSKIDIAWQLRNSRVAISLVAAMLASFLGENWPLEENTTAASLLLFILIVGFQLQPGCESLSEKRSLPHITALGLSTLTTILAVGLNRHGVLRDLVPDPNSDWKAGSWSALVFYQLFLSISLRLEGRGCFKTSSHVKEPPREDLQAEEKATAHEQEHQKAPDATSDD